MEGRNVFQGEGGGHPGPPGYAYALAFPVILYRVNSSTLMRPFLKWTYSSGRQLTVLLRPGSEAGSGSRYAI